MSLGKVSVLLALSPIILHMLRSDERERVLKLVLNDLICVTTVMQKGRNVNTGKMLSAQERVICEKFLRQCVFLMKAFCYIFKNCYRPLSDLGLLCHSSNFLCKCFVQIHACDILLSQSLRDSEFNFNGFQQHIKS